MSELVGVESRSCDSYRNRQIQQRSGHVVPWYSLLQSWDAEQTNSLTEIGETFDRKLHTPREKAAWYPKMPRLYECNGMS